MNSSLEPMIMEDELIPLLKERLSSGHCVRYLPFRGTSMLPMLRQGKDSVELAPLPEKLKKYDLPLYRYPSGKYVMHRVVGVQPDYYICLGDNTYRYEHVTQDQMIAVVSAFKRGDKRISVDSLPYRLYSRFWYWCYPVRKASKSAKRFIRRLIK